MKNNDPRAGFRVMVFPTATNVKFPYRGYEISLAADGQEVIVFDSDGSPVQEFAGTSVESVRFAANWVDAQF